MDKQKYLKYKRKYLLALHRGGAANKPAKFLAYIRGIEFKGIPCLEIDGEITSEVIQIHKCKPTVTIFETKNTLYVYLSPEERSQKPAKQLPDSYKSLICQGKKILEFDGKITSEVIQVHKCKPTVTIFETKNTLYVYLGVLKATLKCKS